MFFVLYGNGGIPFKTVFFTAICSQGLLLIGRFLTPIELDGIYLNINMGHEVWKDSPVRATPIFLGPEARHRSDVPLRFFLAFFFFSWKFCVAQIPSVMSMAILSTCFMSEPWPTQSTPSATWSFVCFSSSSVERNRLASRPLDLAPHPRLLRRRKRSSSMKNAL